MKWSDRFWIGYWGCMVCSYLADGNAAQVGWLILAVVYFVFYFVVDFLESKLRKP